MSKKEGERLHNQFILIHSTPKLHPVPRKPLGIPLAINHILQLLNTTKR